MLTKSKIALATALVALTGSVALAQDLRSPPVKLQSRNAAMAVAAQQSWFEIERADRASSPYAGGG